MTRSCARPGPRSRPEHPLPTMTLREFREQLQRLMGMPGLRPFVCDGSPMGARVFVVGFNPATTMDQPFWHYWSDETGFDKLRFMRDYLEKRGLQEPQGVRARIERIVAQLPRGTVLETNICSLPTSTAAELRRDHRTTRVFRFLLETIRPGIVYAHSNEPVRFFEDLTSRQGFDTGDGLEVSHGDQRFRLLATRGPLFRMGYADAEGLGRRLAALLQAAWRPPGLVGGRCPAVS